MAFQRLQHSGGAVDTTLNSSIGGSDVTIVLDAATGWPDGSGGPFYAVLGRGLGTEEKILVTSRSGNTLSGCTRGVDGSSAAAHASGEVVGHIFTAVEADEANRLVATLLGAVTTKGDLTPASGAGALTRLAAGGDGLPLVAASGQPSGLQYAVLGTAAIGAQAITTAKLATSAVTGNELAAGAVTSVKIADGTITGTDIAAATVTSGNIVDGTITGTDIASASVTSAHIVDGTIATADIADGAVTPAKRYSDFDYVSGSPGGNIDANSASYVDYGPSGTTTIPTWATQAIVFTNISGTSVTSTSNTRFRTQIGSALGNEHLISTNGDTSNEQCDYTDKITLSGTGGQTIKVQARRGSGTGAYRMTSTDFMSFTIIYKP